MESPHEVVQAAYSNTSNSTHQQQWKAVHNIHWRGGEQVVVVVAVAVAVVVVVVFEWAAQTILIESLKG